MTMNPALCLFNHVVAFEVAKDSSVIHVLPADKQSVAANKPMAIRKALLAEMRRNVEVKRFEHDSKVCPSEGWRLG